MENKKNGNKYHEPYFCLLGAPRSGTTLLEKIINMSKQAYLSYECDWISPLLDSFAYYKNSARFYEHFGVERYRSGINKMLCEIFYRKDKWGIQFLGASNAKYYYELAKIFPRAKWIQMIRDPRDTFISTLRTGLSSTPHEFEFIYETIKEISKRNKIETLLTKYEDIVCNPENEIRRICSFLGIEYSSEMLLPLTQNISFNETPALTQTDLQTGKIKPNLQCIKRWQNQLLDEDLLDLNQYEGFIGSLGYKTCSHTNLQLEIKSSKKISGKLIGMSCHADGDINFNSNRLNIDICSAGCIGIEINSHIDDVEQIKLENYGFFRKSSIYDHIYLMRLKKKDYVPINNQKIHTPATLIATGDLRPDQKIGIYTAGGATKSFLKKFHQKKLHRTYSIKYIIDKKRHDDLNGIPVVMPDSPEARSLDCIIITSRVFFDEIRQDIIANKLKGINNTHVVSFGDQDSFWIHSQKIADFDKFI